MIKKSIKEFISHPYSVFLFVISLTYLFWKVYQVSDSAEFDFKFLWLAGNLWSHGINPYTDEYNFIGKQLITIGYVPTMWAYPPNWYLPSILLSQTNINTASIIWNILNTFMLIASSALLTSAYYDFKEQFHSHVKESFFTRHFQSASTLFSLHIFALATLQPSALTISVGQTSILVYLGVSTLIYGTVKNKHRAIITGLTIILLKPQVGIILLIPFLFNRTFGITALKSLVLSIVISLPAFFIAPMSAFDWLSNLMRYDSMNSANWPQSTTGVRNIIWDVFNIDIGNMKAMIIALFMIISFCLILKSYKTETDEINIQKQSMFKMIILSITVIVAIVPLHIYDFLLVGALILLLPQARFFNMVIGLIGISLIWRADDFAKLTGFYGPGTEHFQGTRLTTIGAIFLLIMITRMVFTKPNSVKNSKNKV